MIKGNTLKQLQDLCSGYETVWITFKSATFWQLELLEVVYDISCLIRKGSSVITDWFGVLVLDRAHAQRTGTHLNDE